MVYGDVNNKRKKTEERSPVFFIYFNKLWIGAN